MDLLRLRDRQEEILRLVGLWQDLEDLLGIQVDVLSDSCVNLSAPEPLARS